MPDPTQLITEAFATNSEPPRESVDLAAPANYWESKEFISALLGKRWDQLSEPKLMKEINADAAAWTGHMPIDWFPYYLPALLVVAFSDHGAFGSNLRGLLDLMLVPRPDMQKRSNLINEHLRKNLTPSQHKALEAYLRAVG